MSDNCKTRGYHNPDFFDSECIDCGKDMSVQRSKDIGQACELAAKMIQPQAQSEQCTSDCVLSYGGQCPTCPDKPSPSEPDVITLSKNEQLVITQEHQRLNEQIAKLTAEKKELYTENQKLKNARDDRMEALFSERRTCDERDRLKAQVDDYESEMQLCLEDPDTAVFIIEQVLAKWSKSDG